MTLFSPYPDLAPSSQGTETGCQWCSLGHGVCGSPGSGDTPHGWQPAQPVSSQPPKGSGPMEGAGLAIAMGRGAGGVTQQAGLVRVVSHCQLSLPGWDCRSHLASHWLHWEYQTTNRQEKTPLFPRSSPPAWRGWEGSSCPCQEPIPISQQDRSDMAPPAVRPHPLYRHLRAPTPFFAKGCSHLEGAVSP